MSRVLYAFGMTYADGPVYHTLLTDDEYAIEVLRKREETGEWKFGDELYEIVETHPAIDWEVWRVSFAAFIQGLNLLNVVLPGRDSIAPVLIDVVAMEQKYKPEWFFWWEV